jgi:hypothetical protein
VNEIDAELARIDARARKFTLDRGIALAILVVVFAAAVLRAFGAS